MTRDELLDRAAEHGLLIAPSGGEGILEAPTLEEAEHQRTLFCRISGLKGVHILWGDTKQPVTVGVDSLYRMPAHEWDDPVIVEVWL